MCRAPAWKAVWLSSELKLLEREDHFRWFDAENRLWIQSTGTHNTYTPQVRESEKHSMISPSCVCVVCVSTADTTLCLPPDFTLRCTFHFDLRTRNWFLFALLNRLHADSDFIYPTVLKLWTFFGYLVSAVRKFQFPFLSLSLREWRNCLPSSFWQDSVSHSYLFFWICIPCVTRVNRKPTHFGHFLSESSHRLRRGSSASILSPAWVGSVCSNSSRLHSEPFR